MMAGFQLYNSAGALTIDSQNKSVVVSTVKAMGSLEVIGDSRIVSDFGNGSTLGALPYPFFPESGLKWFQFFTDGSYCFPGASMYEQGTGRFMICSNTTPIQSGYLDVFDAAGNLIWSAASAGTMPRISDFITVPPSHDLKNALTVNTTIANPWICISQCPGNYSTDGTTSGYSGIVIKRNSSTSFSIQYINRFQKTYQQAMGGNGIRIALASFTGY
ncbi:hypothetical protein C2U55_15680 [Enterobacteriaceae bacterium ENNIH3]|nr:hypothetical protein C2U55_15680 [Enterobacteriaceae bacterium ENNIH3]AUV09498.1 hypothetical protein C2U52_26215 [Enterobacteriaceae bacterium ENNIH2]PWF51129.1 hypothetical protein BHT19_0009280 [[Kluyvera] intestini]